jgi:hypothetical protein
LGDWVHHGRGERKRGKEKKMRFKSPPSSPLLILFLLLVYRDDHHVDAFHLHLKSGKISPFPLLSFYVPTATSRSQTSSQFSVCSINNQKPRNEAGVFLADISIKVSQENQRDVSRSGAKNKNMLLLERSYALKLLLAQTITLVSSMALAKAVAADDTEDSSELPRVLLSVPKEIKQLYNDGLAKQIQGNILAANRIFAQVTKLAPEVTCICHVKKKCLRKFSISCAHLFSNIYFLVPICMIVCVWMVKPWEYSSCKFCYIHLWIYRTTASYTNSPLSQHSFGFCFLLLVKYARRVT